jgi:hypothetical protein
MTSRVIFDFIVEAWDDSFEEDDQEEFGQSNTPNQN